MERDEALRLLPRNHNLALRLRAAGADERLIGDCLEVEAEAVAPLLHIAEAKLARLLSSEGPASGA